MARIHNWAWRVLSEKALQGLVDNMLKIHKPGTALRVQVLNSYNVPGAEALRDLIAPVFNYMDAHPLHVASAGGRHRWPSMVGVAFAPADVFEGLP